MNVNIAKGKSVVIMLFPILFIIMPRPPLNSTDFLVYPIIGLFCLYFTIVISKNYRFNMRVLFISFVIMLYSISISISAFFSNITLGFGALIHIFKPLLFILCLIFGYFIGVSCKSDKIFRYLLKAAYIIILVQIVIGLAQLFGLHLFDIIYSPSKARSLGQIVRITGTLDNPNLFAWFVIQMTLIIYLFENNKIKKILFIIIGVLLVFLSGSRTLFCLFPVILLMTQILLSNKNAKYYFTKIPKYIFLFILNYESK
ncbi:hypothetical protein P9214_14860, partial [Heyndrickxia coagulans]|uniref:hypothetical protein n=1 Tax=Heyndrickxia coagulans TaxID=1398 RepID=UPI002E1BBD07|nr:hypothetical protein [Heyndrickxia coagulans]